MSSTTSRHERADEVPHLPDGVEIQSVVGEGCANVVYRLAYRGSGPCPVEIKGQLLRLQKAALKGSQYLSYQEQMDFYDREVRPLFRAGDLVDQKLVHVNSDILHQAQACLDATARKDRFKGKGIDLTAVHALLLKDMTVTPRATRRSSDGGGKRIGKSANTNRQSEDDAVYGVAIEVKTKWLTESPSYPNGTRCRNCALSLAREKLNFAKSVSQPRKSSISPSRYRRSSTNSRRQRISRSPPALDPAAEEVIINPCALLAVSPRKEDRLEYVQKLLALNKVDPKYEKVVTNWFVQYGGKEGPNPLLVALQDAQFYPQPMSPLDVEDETNADGKLEMLSRIMTFRDCSVMLRITHEDPECASDEMKVEACLLDLDKKNSMLKLYKWKRTEEELIDQGWYTSTKYKTGCLQEKLCNAKSSRSDLGRSSQELRRSVRALESSTTSTTTATSPSLSSSISPSPQRWSSSRVSLANTTNAVLTGPTTPMSQFPTASRVLSHHSDSSTSTTPSSRSLASTMVTAK